MKIFTPARLDEQIYETELRNFLPDAIIDIHSHLGVPGTMTKPSAERSARYWPLRLPAEQTVAEFLEAYDLLLPGKRVSICTFGLPRQESDIEKQNRAVIEAARQHPGRIHPLFVVRPENTEAEIERAIDAGFLGLKPYPGYARSDHPGEERIPEFLTPGMCAVANRRQLPVILHISKKARFADPENISDLLALSEDYPGMRLVVAHLGRSYNPYFLEKALAALNGRHPWWYDFSAVTNPEVFALALAAIPHERICFGLDNPLMLSRGYYEFPAPDRYQTRICGINLAETEHPTLAYQILLGFKKAAVKAGISPASLQRIFHDNACEVLGIEADRCPPREVAQAGANASR